ncbi:MAG: AraC family transcriptional regulator [Paenibacillaceae bacterium]|jgi:AraC-like DNA-binding protein/mannose-6-phosphate isomerase-like protein (cupin superfamily)|nr:AraC family transcriptional regulator [Paenibacillaceae bacterium]
MAEEKRTVCYDTELEMEAYRFEGVMQKFPNHFHDYYVIGFIEAGQRLLVCKNQEYIINPGDITVFNPGDVHSCEQLDGRALDYRCLNIRKDAMERMVREITGRSYLPRCKRPVLVQSELAASLCELHRMILAGERDMGKEELALLFIGQFLQEEADLPLEAVSCEPEEAGLKAACTYMDDRYHQPVSLDGVSSLAGLSKYHFLRLFTRSMGITPYCYLQAVRIGRAKQLLEQGMPPSETAQRTGFSDQSHFTHTFKRLIGLTPRQYMRIFSGPVRQPARQGGRHD